MLGGSAGVARASAFGTAAVGTTAVGVPASAPAFLAPLAPSPGDGDTGLGAPCLGHAMDDYFKLNATKSALDDFAAQWTGDSPEELPISGLALARETPTSISLPNVHHRVSRPPSHEQQRVSRPPSHEQPDPQGSNDRIVSVQI